MYYSELRNALISSNLIATTTTGPHSKKAAHKEPEGHQGASRHPAGP